MFTYHPRDGPPTSHHPKQGPQPSQRKSPIFQRMVTNHPQGGQKQNQGWLLFFHRRSFAISRMVNKISIPDTDTQPKIYTNTDTDIFKNIHADTDIKKIPTIPILIKQLDNQISYRYYTDIHSIPIRIPISGVFLYRYRYQVFNHTDTDTDTQNSFWPPRKICVIFFEVWTVATFQNLHMFCI